jgi:hypothetical protein
MPCFFVAQNCARRPEARQPAHELKRKGQDLGLWLGALLRKVGHDLRHGGHAHVHGARDVPECVGTRAWRSAIKHTHKPPRANAPHTQGRRDSHGRGAARRSQALSCGLDGLTSCRPAARRPCRAGKQFNGFPGDIWALGICLYMFVFGKPPFNGSTTYQIYECIQKSDPAFPADIPISDELKASIRMRALAQRACGSASRPAAALSFGPALPAPLR